MAELGLNLAWTQMLSSFCLFLPRIYQGPLKSYTAFSLEGPDILKALENKAIHRILSLGFSHGKSGIGQPGNAFPTCHTTPQS